MVAFAIGLVVMAAWSGVCFWLAVRHQRLSAARGVRPDRNYLKSMIAAGAGGVIMFFVLIFLTLNPPPASLDTMRP